MKDETSREKMLAIVNGGDLGPYLNVYSLSSGRSQKKIS